MRKGTDNIIAWWCKATARAFVFVMYLFCDLSSFPLFCPELEEDCLREFNDRSLSSSDIRWGSLSTRLKGIKSWLTACHYLWLSFLFLSFFLSFVRSSLLHHPQGCWLHSWTPRWRAANWTRTVSSKLKRWCATPYKGESKFGPGVARGSGRLLGNWRLP